MSMTKISVRIPTELEDDIKASMEEMGIGTMSEFIRVALELFTDYVREEDEEEDDDE